MANNRIHSSHAWHPRHTLPLLRGVSHVVGACVAVPLVIFLLIHARPGPPTWLALMYGVIVVNLLGVSGLYHVPSWTPETYHRLQRIDHGNIYLMIAGSYTPIGLNLPPPVGPILLVAVWIASLLGALESWLWLGMRREIRSSIYIVLGGSLAGTWSLVLEHCGPSIMVRFLGGGALYIGGAIIYAIRRPDPWPKVFGHHEIFHLCVLIGALIHYTAIWDLLT
ncbi:MAG: PAQR family membrane homeostasis protein TrhA [Nannocystaceae bacterium]